MCVGKYYSEEEMKKIEKLGKYATDILTGKRICDVALENGIDEKMVSEAIEEIKGINPSLYEQLMEILRE